MNVLQGGSNTAMGLITITGGTPNPAGGDHTVKMKVKLKSGATIEMTTAVTVNFAP